MEIFRPEESALAQGADIFCWAEEIEDLAYLQAIHLSNLPFLFKHVALMPDAHAGKGMPIGGVIACKNVVIPNAVGLDIGCGMIFVLTNRSIYDRPQEELPSLLEKIRHSIKRCVPVGMNIHHHCKNWSGFLEYTSELTEKPGWMNDKSWDRALKSLGTLGGGNHFIEIQRVSDQHSKIGIMIHSGSRNLGKCIAEYYHYRALEMCEKWCSKLPHKDLAFLPMDSRLGQDYIRDMNFALKFAFENRQRMMTVAKQQFQYYTGEETAFEEEINIHHNYASLEHHMGQNVWIHRKGATSAQKDQLGIIPGSMGTSSYIVKGKGNPLSFESCSHGAGRKMSRTEACLTLNVEDCAKDMGDVLYDKWGKVSRGRAKNMPDVAEAPAAYKDIDRVIKNQRDLVEVVARLRPLAVVKG